MFGIEIDAFVRAILAGDIASLKELLRQNPEMLERTFSWRGNFEGSALHCAAYYNQPGIIEFLVKEKKMDANRRNCVGNTPLHHAKRAHAHQAAAALLELGARSELDNNNREDTIGFCQSENVQKNLEQKKAREGQKKIAGTWTRTTSKEVVHEYELPEQHYRLTDTFNFEARFWRSIVQNQFGNGVAQNILFFDDIPDTEILHQAFQKLKDLGGDADEALIDSRPLRGKALRSKTL